MLDDETTAEAETTHDPETGEVTEDEAVVADLKLDTLSGDIRDAFLTRFRNAPKPWQQMTEDEQYDFANGVELFSKELVRQAVRLVTDWDFPRAVVSLGEVKIKGEKGIEAKIIAANIEHNRNVLGDHVGEFCTIVMVDSAEFMAERAPVEITPDQPEMELGDGEDEEQLEPAD